MACNTVVLYSFISAVPVLTQPQVLSIFRDFASSLNLQKVALRCVNYRIGDYPAFETMAVLIILYYNLLTMEVVIFWVIIC